MAVSLRKMLLLGAAAARMTSAAVMTTPPEAKPTGSITETHITFVDAVKRQEAPTNCVYVEDKGSKFHTECRVNAPVFGGGKVTKLSTSSVHGLPNGGVAFQTITTTAAISISLPTATNQPWKINMTPQLRQKIIDSANECADGEHAKVRKHKRAGSLSFDWGALDAGYRGGCLRKIGNIVGDAGIMVVDPVGKYHPDYSKLVPGKMIEKLDLVLHNVNDVLIEMDIPFEGMPTLSKGDGSSSSKSSATTTFFPGGKPDPTKTSSAATSTASEEADEDEDDDEEEEKPACPTDATIDPNDDQGQDGPPPTPTKSLSPANKSAIASNQAAIKSAHDSMTKALGLVPGAAPQTCSETITAPKPICTLTRQTTNPYKPSQQCLCPDGDNMRTVTASTSTITTCDANGSGTFIDVCAWQTPPPKSMDIPYCQTETKSPLCAAKRVPASWNLPETRPAQYCSCTNDVLYYPSPVTVEMCKTPYPTKISGKPTTVTPTPDIGTSVQFCPYTAIPPVESLIKWPEPSKKKYAGGELPPVNVLAPFCDPMIPADYNRKSVVGWDLDALETVIWDFCVQAHNRRDEFKPGSVEKSLYRHYAMKGKVGKGAKKNKNQAFPGGKSAENVAIYARYESKACEAPFFTRPFEFRDAQRQCRDRFMAAVTQCRSFHRGPSMTDQSQYWSGGAIYSDCMWWEVSPEFKFDYDSSVSGKTD